MTETQSLEEVRRTMLLRSMYVLAAPVFIVFAVLACIGTALTSSPVYTCPTPIPLPTATTLAGTPLPTAGPQPTPYIIRPPAAFFIGDAVFVGSSRSANGVRFRLQNVTRQSASPSSDGTSRTVYGWQLEVKNIGREPYEIFPSTQMVINRIMTANGDMAGVWPATQQAADEMGITLDSGAYRLELGERRVFRFAAYGPVGEAEQFTLDLTPTITDDRAVITWVNQSNPHCTGDIANP